MDERVLRWITLFTGILTAVICLGVYYSPEIRLWEVLAAEQTSTDELIKNLPQPVVTTAPENVVEEEAVSKGQLQIGLPQMLREDQVELTNDYLSQTLFIRFAGGVSDYFAEYGMRGKSDHIASLSYYKDGDFGVIALQMDRVYEYSCVMEQGNLYLDFTDPHEIYEKVVVVDAGHGGIATGSVKRGTAEKDINLAILLELKEIFEESGENIGVYYTRLTDNNPTLDQRVQLANKANADLFISIHNNANISGNFSRANGTSVLYSESDQSELSSKRFAQICLDQVVEGLKSTRRGVFEGDQIYIIRTSDVPVALIEVGFMTNEAELDKLVDTKYQRKAAKSIYKAVLQAFQEGF